MVRYFYSDTEKSNTVSLFLIKTKYCSENAAKDGDLKWFSIKFGEAIMGELSIINQDIMHLSKNKKAIRSQIAGIIKPSNFTFSLQKKFVGVWKKLHVVERKNIFFSPRRFFRLNESPWKNAVEYILLKKKIRYKRFYCLVDGQRLLKIKCSTYFGL